MHRRIVGLLLVAGVLYASCSMGAEIEYARGLRAGELVAAVRDMRASAAIFPFDRRFRIASASLLGNIALENADAAFLKAAVPELKVALQTDPTEADLLAMLIAFDLASGNTAEAQTYYDTFKIVAKQSPLIEMVNQAKRKILITENQP